MGTNAAGTVLRLIVVITCVLGVYKRTAQLASQLARYMHSRVWERRKIIKHDVFFRNTTYSLLISFYIRGGRMQSNLYPLFSYQKK